MDVGVLVVMGGHIEHLQPGQRVIAQGRHPLCMLPLCCQPFCVGHVRPQGWPGCQREALSLQGPQARVKGERVQARWAGLQGQTPVSREGIQAWPRDPMEGFQLAGLHLEAGLEAVAEVSFPGFPLPLPGSWVTAVQGRDVVTQEPWVHCPEGT